MREKIFITVFLFFVVLLWNRIVIRGMHYLMIWFHQQFNKENLEKRPIKSMIENKKANSMASQLVFWLFYLIFILMIWKY